MYCSYPLQYWTASAVLMLFLHSTDAIPPAVLMLFPHSTEQPLQYWCYPPHVLMLSPHSTESLRSTEQPLQYWTDVIRGDQVAQCWFNRLYSVIVRLTEKTLKRVQPSSDWTASAVLMLFLHSTDAIPPALLMLFPHSTEQPLQYWCYPPTCTDAIPP